MMPTRRGPQKAPQSGRARELLAAKLTEEYEDGASITKLIATHGCDYRDLMAMLDEAKAVRRTTPVTP